MTKKQIKEQLDGDKKLLYRCKCGEEVEIEIDRRYWQIIFHPPCEKCGSIICIDTGSLVLNQKRSPFDEPS